MSDLKEIKKRINDPIPDLALDPHEISKQDFFRQQPEIQELSNEFTEKPLQIPSLNPDPGSSLEKDLNFDLETPKQRPSPIKINKLTTLQRPKRSSKKPQVQPQLIVYKN